MNLSKSKYCQGIQCKKILWLNKYKPEERSELNNDNILENGTKVGEIAKYLFGEYINIEFNDNLSEMLKDTQNVINNNLNAVITEASFNYESNFCSVDILIKKDNNYEIYEVKSSTELKDIYLDDISYQRYVLTNLGYNVTKTSIVHINSKYIRNGELELDKLFTIEDVTDITISKQEELKENIKDINEYMKQTDEPIQDISLNCHNPYTCPYFEYCTKHLPNQNVFKVREMHMTKKMDLYHNNKYRYEDLLNEKINYKYKQQIEFELYDKEPIINKDKVKEFLDNLYYPLYFLDFETYQQPIPMYDGISPYMQIPFQYSLHYIKEENSKLEHTDFLAEPNIDPRRLLAERLVEDIPKDSCILAYNMKFEKMVIRNLANLYVDLSDHLMNIHDNMQDLMVVFKKRDYYTKEMYGSYSIKYVLPALFPDDPELDYHNLDLIHNGAEASGNYANLGEYSQEEQDKIKNALLKYCELDTYAMVKIWQKLNEVTKND